MAKQTAKEKKKKVLHPEVFYLGKLWKVVGKREGSQGEPWLHLKNGSFSAMAKEYEVIKSFN